MLTHAIVYFLLLRFTRRYPPDLVSLFSRPMFKAIATLCRSGTPSSRNIEILRLTRDFFFGIAPLLVLQSPRYGNTFLVVSFNSPDSFRVVHFRPLRHVGCAIFPASGRRRRLLTATGSFFSHQIVSSLCPHCTRRTRRCQTYTLLRFLPC